MTASLLRILVDCHVLDLTRSDLHFRILGHDVAARGEAKPQHRSTSPVMDWVIVSACEAER